jgi:ATP-dependent DNA helicase RecG
LLKENANIEFKEIWNDDYLKVIAAFANAGGGKLYIGIRDDGHIVGVDNFKKLLENIPNKVVQFLGVTVELDLIEKEGKHVLRFRVEPSSVPISFRGKYYIRSGSTVQELHGHELRNFILKKDNITWDEITVPQAHIADLDENLIQRFVTIATRGKEVAC